MEVVSQRVWFLFLLLFNFTATIELRTHSIIQFIEEIMNGFSN